MLRGTHIHAGSEALGVLILFDRTAWKAEKATDRLPHGAKGTMLDTHRPACEDLAETSSSGTPTASRSGFSRKAIDGGSEQ